MNRSIITRTIPVALLLVAIFGIESTPIVEGRAKSPDALVNAIGAYNSNPWGSQARITTANPYIGDGAYSWVRTAVQYNPVGSGTNYYAEIGWWKDSTGIHVHVVSNSPIEYFSLSYSQQPVNGTTHTYQVFWNSGLNGYDLRYDGALITNRSASLTLTRVTCGGEANSSANAIGISTCKRNKYANSSTGNWLLFPSHYNEAAPGYWVNDISASAWEVGGNN